MRKDNYDVTDLQKDAFAFLKQAKNFNKLSEEERRRQFSILPRHATDEDLDEIISKLSFDDITKEIVKTSKKAGSKDNYWFIQIRPTWMQKCYQAETPAKMFLAKYGQTFLDLNRTPLTANQNVFLIHQTKFGRETIQSEFDLNESKSANISKFMQD